jgi:hypothetical protein
MEDQATARHILVDNLKKQVEFLFALAPTPPNATNIPPKPSALPTTLMLKAPTTKAKAVPAALPKSKRMLVNKHDQGPLPTTELNKIRTTINQLLREAKAPAKATIVSLSQIVRGNISLTTRTDCSATTTMQYGSIIDKALSSTTTIS